MTKGEKISATKKRLGQRPPSRLGIKHSKETKRKIGLWGKGRKHSPEERLKISLGVTGKKRRPHSQEYREAMSKKMKGRIISLETRKKWSISRRGKNNPQWKGGITPIHWLARQSLEYKLWRKAVYERDNYTCQVCGEKRPGELEAHHIKRFALYPDLRFAIDNGVTLCCDCHKLTDTYGTKGLTKEDYACQAQ